MSEGPATDPRSGFLGGPRRRVAPIPADGIGQGPYPPEEPGDATFPGLEHRGTPPGGSFLREIPVGGLLMLWGSVLLLVFILDLVAGYIFALSSPLLLVPVWVASLVLSAGGAWLAFDLSDTEAFDVSNEPAPRPG